MRNWIKNTLAVLVGVGALGLTGATITSAAAARPDYCRVDHDHRSHDRDYYDYYERDRYYRDDPRGVSFSVTLGNRGDYRDRRYRDRRYADRRGYRRGSRIINRQTYDTRYRARIVLVEEVFYSRRGERLVCTVSARGPESRYVPRKRLRRIARRGCSRYADVRIRR